MSKSHAIPAHHRWLCSVRVARAMPMARWIQLRLIIICVTHTLSHTLSLTDQINAFAYQADVEGLRQALKQLGTRSELGLDKAGRTALHYALAGMYVAGSGSPVHAPGHMAAFELLVGHTETAGAWELNRMVPFMSWCRGRVPDCGRCPVQECVCCAVTGNLHPRLA